MIFRGIRRSDRPFSDPGDFGVMTFSALIYKDLEK